MAIYTLGSAREKFDVWHEVAPQLKFLCGLLERNSWVDQD